MKKIRTLAITLLLATALLLVGCNSKEAPLFSDLDFTAVDPANCEETTQVTNYVKLTVKDYGDILIRLYPDVAPKTVANFQKLVAEGFYTGLTFHRVISGFMIQGGASEDKKADTVYGEFSANGYTNNLKHIRGVISMARLSSDYNSASSQFFIVHKTSAHLNGQYAAFGYVVSGLEVVDAIAAVSTDSSDKPRTDVVIEKAVFVTVNGK